MTGTLSAIAIAVALLGAGCLQDIDAPPAKLTEDVPWVVRVDFEPGNFCTAMALSEHWLLTAGHCLTRSLPRAAFETQSEIRVRAMRMGEKELLYQGGAKLVLHPEYDDGRGPSHRWYDVGLIALEEPIKLDGYARIAGETLTFEHFASGDPMFAVGAGYIPDPETGRCTRRQGSIRRYDGFVYLRSSGPRQGPAEMVKLVGRPHALCHGDSGAPMMFGVDGVPHVFAVFSGARRDRRVFHASLAAPKLRWIATTSKERRIPLECIEMGPNSWGCFE